MTLASNLLFTGASGMRLGAFGYSGVFGCLPIIESFPNLGRLLGAFEYSGFLGACPGSRLRFLLSKLLKFII